MTPGMCPHSWSSSAIRTLLLRPFFRATYSGGRNKAIRTSRTVIVLLGTGSGTGVRGGTRQELPTEVNGLRTSG